MGVALLVLELLAAPLLVGFVSRHDASFLPTCLAGQEAHQLHLMASETGRNSMHGGAGLSQALTPKGMYQLQQ
jgi:hypothetical protein